MKTFRCWIAVCLVSSLMMVSFKASAAFQLEVLEGKLTYHLNNIRDEAHRERWTSGLLLLGVGALGEVGAVSARNSNSNTAGMLEIYGGVALAAGIATLLFPTELEDAPERFFDMPRKNHEELLRKVSMGEDALRQLAFQARRTRLYGSLLMGLVGAGELIWYATTPNDQYRLIAGLVFTGLAGLTYFAKRTAELEWGEYSHWKAAEKTAVRWGISPTRNGAMALVSVDF